MKVAVITGGTRGLGRAIAEKFISDNMKVYIVGSSEAIYDTEKEINNEYINAIQCDIRNEEEVKNMVSKILEKEHKIDILINNAGLGYFKNLEDYTTEEYMKMFNVNVYGLFLVTKYFLPSMKENKDGIILNIASDVSRRTFPGGSLYIATKYAVQGLTGGLAQEVREYGIRVGTINPGMIDTYFAGSTQGDKGKEGFLQTNDLADLISYVVKAPKSMNIDEIVVHPIIQDYSLS